MIWDGSSKTRQNPNVRRAPDGWDYAETIAQIQQLQREISPIYAVAFSNLSENRIVRLRIGGQIEYADFNSGSVLGMVTMQSTPGQPVPVSTFGVVSSSDWTSTAGTANLSPGMDYYLGTSGMITSIPPISGFLVKVGLALTLSDFLVRIGLSVRL